jgi:DNA-binding Xre family transcriptional regulator
VLTPTSPSPRPASRAANASAINPIRPTSSSRTFAARRMRALIDVERPAIAIVREGTTGVGLRSVIAGTWSAPATQLADEGSWSHCSPMDDVRLGRIGRYLRQRLGWRQEDLGNRIGLSQGSVSLFERGRIEGMPVGTVRRIFGGLEAELVLFVRWRGGDLDRLLDAGHA